MKRCFLYPGQGAQFVGMGKDLYDRYPDVQELFALASERAGFDLPQLVFSGTEEEIKSTDKSQVAITAVNLAARRVLARRGIVSAATAGFSLGEYAALVDAGILSEADALSLVVDRGRIMEEVSRSLDAAEGAAGMAAVLGIDVDAIQQALAGAGVGDVYPANLNSPVQTVLSGTAAGLEAAATVLKEAGARRVVRLKVSGPFHSPLMDEARVRFSESLAEVEFRDPEKPVYSNVTGSLINTGAEARTLCADQLVKPVRWVDEEALIARDDYDELLEVGPGEVLSGLWRAYLKVHSDVMTPCLAAGTVEQIAAITIE
ncbi:MAG: ACP S-malonyltransferase [Spirochaetota bacterium]